VNGALNLLTALRSRRRGSGSLVFSRSG